MAFVFRPIGTAKSPGGEIAVEAGIDDEPIGAQSFTTLKVTFDNKTGKDIANLRVFVRVEEGEVTVFSHHALFPRLDGGKVCEAAFPVYNLTAAPQTDFALGIEVHYTSEYLGDMKRRWVLVMPEENP